MKDTSTFSGKNENSAKLLVENGKTIVSNTGPLLRVMTDEEKQSLRVTPAELKGGTLSAANITVEVPTLLGVEKLP